MFWQWNGFKFCRSNGTRRSCHYELSHMELQATGCTPPAPDVVVKQILRELLGRRTLDKERLFPWHLYICAHMCLINVVNVLYCAFCNVKTLIDICLKVRQPSVCLAVSQPTALCSAYNLTAVIAWCKNTRWLLTDYFIKTLWYCLRGCTINRSLLYFCISKGVFDAPRIQGPPLTTGHINHNWNLKDYNFKKGNLAIIVTP